MDTQNTNRRPFQTAGQRLDDFLGDASKRIEEETKLMIDYINDEVVPLIREHSSKGLRIASQKLGEMAEYMETNSKKTQG